jgi:hypothetical protein
MMYEDGVARLYDVDVVLEMAIKRLEGLDGLTSRERLSCHVALNDVIRFPRP